MFNTITRKINLQSILFVASCYFIFTSINLFYVSTEAPDYIFYKDYFDYFFYNESTTGRDNGLIYFFLVSCVLKIQEFQITPTAEIHYISNSIQIVNFLLYQIGLFGLYKLLSFKKYLKKDIMLSFAVLNFMPFTVKLITTMKPEILAFALLPWSLLCIELFFKTKRINYLYLSIFPNLILLSTKNTIIATVVAIYFFILIKNFRLFKNVNLLKPLLLFIFLYFIILYENYLGNGYFILNHVPEGGLLLIPPEERVSFGFIYNINFADLIQKPYRHNHANSLIGLLLLDNFGDYFQWYANNSRSLFALDNYKIQGFWYFGNVKELTGLFLGLITYFFIFKYIKKYKEIRIYLALPFFSFFVFLLNVFIRREYFEPSRAELFKSHYYSYLFLITFAFVLLSFLKKQKNYKFFLLIVLILSSLYLHGFLKNTYSNTNQYLSVKNNVSQFCEINRALLPLEDNNSCDNYIENLCYPNYLLIDVRYLLNKENINIDNFPIELINKEGNKVIATNTEGCKSYVEQGYKFESIYNNKVKIPFLNLIYLTLSLLSFYKIHKLSRNEINT